MSRGWNRQGGNDLDPEIDDLIPIMYQPGERTAQDNLPYDHPVILSHPTPDELVPVSNAASVTSHLPKTAGYSVVGRSYVDTIAREMFLGPDIHDKYGSTDSLARHIPPVKLVSSDLTAKRCKRGRLPLIVLTPPTPTTGVFEGDIPILLDGSVIPYGQIFPANVQSGKRSSLGLPRGRVDVKRNSRPVQKFSAEQNRVYQIPNEQDTSVKMSSLTRYTITSQKDSEALRTTTELCKKYNVKPPYEGLSVRMTGALEDKWQSHEPFCVTQTLPPNRNSDLFVPRSPIPEQPSEEPHAGGSQPGYQLPPRSTSPSYARTTEPKPGEGLGLETFLSDDHDSTRADTVQDRPVTDSVTTQAPSPSSPRPAQERSVPPSGARGGWRIDWKGFGA